MSAKCHVCGLPVKSGLRIAEPGRGYTWYHGSCAPEGAWPRVIQEAAS